MACAALAVVGVRPRAAGTVHERTCDVPVRREFITATVTDTEELKDTHICVSRWPPHRAAKGLLPPTVGPILRRAAKGFGGSKHLATFALDDPHDTAYGITMNVTRIVIDTNILVCGLRSRRGMSYQLLSFLGGRLYRPVVSVPLVVEYEKSLCAPKTEVPFSPGEIGKYLDYFCSVSDCRKVHFLWRPFLRDPYDDMVLEAAVSGRCAYIVTFNIRDFKGVEKFGIVAITPGDFLKLKGKIL